ncbi:hypothetical protein SS1G_10115 [Sclerotinia sclerotiorum 1980 UF-70]|uniref:ribonuclease H n=1 Tax=Sclerotinia sclerotiorum (strain ATCC 18683 / 1980 / Ss-1) TaxID=665079 RepID=A7EXQ0_SCLS1|nr:hypothetical protein SS1G_10115 [Sclerotinia sclerotiorum 1980 UF-70]EDN94242.1 hypothetical protein SS1G_10115 [Sclerotinia sclerotiorum 1980 UF-70]
MFRMLAGLAITGNSLPWTPDNSLQAGVYKIYWVSPDNTQSVNSPTFTLGQFASGSSNSTSNSNKNQSSSIDSNKTSSSTGTSNPTTTKGEATSSSSSTINTPSETNQTNSLTNTIKITIAISITLGLTLLLVIAFMLIRHRRHLASIPRTKRQLTTREIADDIDKDSWYEEHQLKSNPELPSDSKAITNSYGELMRKKHVSVNMEPVEMEAFFVRKDIDIDVDGGDGNHDRGDVKDINEFGLGLGLGNVDELVEPRELDAETTLGRGVIGRRFNVRDNVHIAAKLYNITNTTLLRRMNGLAPRTEIRANSHKITDLEEEVLIQYIIDMDERGFAPKLSGVEDIANYILESRRAKKVGKLWAKPIQENPSIIAKPRPSKNPRSIQNLTNKTNGNRSRIVPSRKKENQDVVATPQRKQLKPTQLEKIKNSIQKDFDPLTLEGIHHFYFPPWKKEVPYKVNISKLGKEEAAMIHNLAFKYRCKNTITIYTDALSTLEGIGIGIGIAIILPNGRISHQETINIGVNQLVYNGELLGVTKAIEYANSIAQPGNKFKIYSDNQAGLFRSKTPSDLPGQSCQIKAIKAAEAIQNKGAEISLNWVPGHTSVQGNELADSLAKEATKIPSSSHETSYASIGMDIKRMKSENWMWGKGIS